MAYSSDTAQGHGFVARTIKPLSAIWQSLSLAYAQNRIYRQTYNELASLSDSELADLGLHRSEISRIAKDAAQMAR